MCILSLATCVPNFIRISLTLFEFSNVPRLKILPDEDDADDDVRDAEDVNVGDDNNKDITIA